MKTIFKSTVALCAALLATASFATAQSNSALIDALVRKGVLTSKEASEIQADLAKNYDEGSTSKIELSKHVTKLKLYGKVRWRYQWNEASTQNPVSPNLPAGNPNPSQTVQQQNRFRYLFKVGATYDFTDNFRSGIEIASGDNNDSYNQTIGSGYGRFPVSLSLLYLEWQPTDWLTLTGGKQLNPLYTTSLVWDSDVNPEGLTEQAWWDLSDSFSIGFTAGQWAYMNDTTQGSGGPLGAEDTPIVQFVQQIPMQYRWMEYETVQVPAGGSKGGKNFDGKMMTVTQPKEILSVTFAPGFMTYLGGSTTNVNTSTPRFAAPNGSYDLNIVTAPGDVKWKSWGIPFKFYWDFAWNVSGGSRNGVYTTPTVAGAGPIAYQNNNRSLEDDIAWLAGLKLGTNKKKGDWSVQADYRVVGAGAVDPNLNDSDFNLGYLNGQGVRAQAQYNFTDFLVGSVTYFNTWNYKEDLFFPNTVEGGSAPGFSSGNGLTGVNGTQIVQVDLKWKF